MAMHRSFDVLSDVVAQLERDGSLRSVGTTVDSEASTVLATVEISVSDWQPPGTAAGRLNPVGAAIRDDGSLEVTFADADAVFPSFEADGVEVVERHLHTATGEGLVATMELRIGDAAGDQAASAEGESTASEPVPAEDGFPTGSPADCSSATATGSSDVDAGDGAPPDREGEGSTLAGVRDPSVPPYDDRPYLRRLYEVCETFSEMSERIEMDVSAETVRRYMIDAGLHEPSSYGTTEGGDESAEDAPAAPNVPTEDQVAGAVEETKSGGPGEESEESVASVDGRGHEDIEDSGGHEDIEDSGGHEDSEDSGGHEDSEDSASLEDSEDGAGHEDSGDATPMEMGLDLPETSQVLPEGTGIPEDLEMHDVVDAVADARSVYEVARALDMDQGVVREMLYQLDLIDLVSFRLADAGDHETSYESVTARLRRGQAEVA